MDEVLKPFIDDMKKLVCVCVCVCVYTCVHARVCTCVCVCVMCVRVFAIVEACFFFQEKGVRFDVNGRTTVYHGSLALVSADNLGSLALGGFKESCTANCMCRQCLATI